MRKAFLLLTISLLLLTSCTFFQKKEEIPPPPPEEVRIEKKIGLVGTAKDQNILESPTVFVLVTENGETIFIDSLNVNLKKYRRRRVEAEGNQQTKPSNVFLIERVTSLGNETAVKQPYLSSEFGLKFSYPSLWFLKEEKNVLGFQKILITPYEVEENEISTIDRITIERLENNRRVSARKFLGLDEDYQPTDPHDTGSVYQKSSISASQLDAVKRTVGAGDTIDFYVSRDTFLYRFSHTTVNDFDKDIYRNVFYEIVAGFEFIPFGKQATGGTSTEPNSKRRDEIYSVPTPLPSSPPSLGEVRQKFITYLKENIGSLAPEPASVGGSWAIQSVQFAFPEGKPLEFNALYVTYSDGHDLRKILLSVSDRTNPADITRAAYFKPGETTDWQIIEGTDTAKNTEKALVQVSGRRDGIYPVPEEIVIKKGMALLDARLFKVKIQYPAKWYWAKFSGGYNFSNKPVEASNILVRLTKDSGQLGSEQSAAEELVLCKPATGANAGMNYCLKGKIEYQDMMKQMLETLQE